MGLRLPENARFSNKQIMIFMLPILFEQLMVGGLNIADTFMVSFLGETAVAGVALVTRIDNFVKLFLTALAQGGSVVMSQYIGAKDDDLSKMSLKNNIRIVILIGISIMLLMVAFRPWVLSTLFGGAEADVLEISNTYFMVTAFSYPFVALFYGTSASFRAMGESKIPFISAVLMMVINLILKYTFIFKLNMGVSGAALSTLISMAIVGFIKLMLLHKDSNKVKLEGFLKFDFNKSNIKRILGISVPNGIEQGMFQLGALLIAGLVSGLGTASIAADSIARTTCVLIHSMGTAFAAVMMMIVGVCMGAGDIEETKMYEKHILKLDYLMTFINGVLFIAFLKPLVSLFDVSQEAQTTAYQILILYTVGSVFLYPASFAVPSALRGTGDTKFVMMVASGSMFIFRIGAAYFFVYALDMGVIGTWVAMVSDWVIRSIIFAVRFKRGKWQKHKVI